MKKTSGFLFVLLLGGLASGAQTYEPVNPQKDRQEFKGYTIRVLPAPGRTYGYDLLRDGQRVLHQAGNPFTGAPQGLASKDEVYRVAQWQIQHLPERPVMAGRPSPSLRGGQPLPPAVQARLGRAPGTPQPLLHRQLPLQVARELHIRLRPQPIVH